MPTMERRGGEGGEQVAGIVDILAFHFEFFQAKRGGKGSRMNLKEKKEREASLKIASNNRQFRIITGVEGEGFHCNNTRCASAAQVGATASLIKINTTGWRFLFTTVDSPITKLLRVT